MEKKVKLGSVVRLKGGNALNPVPVMVVTIEPATNDTRRGYGCIWFYSGLPQFHSFPAESLEVISE